MTAAADVDGTDLEIIDLLERDARRTFAAIGAQVNLSAPAVKRRIDRLERLGVIKGYTVIVDRAQIGRPLEAFTELRFAGATPVSEIRSVVMSVPEVEAVFTVSGDPDALAWIARCRHRSPHARDRPVAA